MTNASTRKADSAIAIGCSAGGLDALKCIFSALPPEFPCAVFVTVHRHKYSGTALLEVLRKCSRLEIIEPDDGCPVVSGKIYLAPRDYHMLIERNQTIALSVEAPVCYCRPAIDVMFQTAAWAYRQRLAAVILTGANADGSEGLKEVRESGGLCIVESPDTAAFPTMPRKAIEAVTPDYVLDLGGIGSRLRDFAELRPTE